MKHTTEKSPHERPVGPFTGGGQGQAGMRPGEPVPRAVEEAQPLR